MKLSTVAFTCLFGLSGAASQAQLEGPFSCYGVFEFDDYDSEPETSSSYDVLVLYRNYNTGTQPYVHYGWGESLPNLTHTNLDDYILELDGATLAAQWDHSSTPRLNWDPDFADIVIYE